MKLNRNIKIFINYFFGPLLFVWLAYSIYHEVKHQPNLEKSWQHIRASLDSPMIGNLAIVILLMIVNWGIEAFKWKLSIQKIQKVKYSTAFKAILSGVSFSVSTPNRVGEYLGRVLYMEEGNRIKAISLTIVGSMSQLIITLFMGAIGFIVLLPRIEAGQIISFIWIKVIIYGVIGVLAIMALFYFRLSWLVKWVDRLPGSHKYAHWIKALEDVDTTLLLQLLLLSTLRFGVFAAQYFLLFRLFEVDILWWQGFWAVSVSFLVLAVIPTFAIAELAQRGYIAKTIVGLYSTNIAGILFTTAGIWFINLVMPAIAGSLLILGIRKIFNNKNERI
jgi:Lysylphosphatidylglycerol synthase TM region